MKISNETKVGVLSAISITILILGFNFLKGENVFTKENEFVAVYQQVDGLFASNPVLINGYKVGQVSEVKMDNKTLNLYVVIKVPNDIKIPRNTIAKIVNNDLLGSKAVELLMGDSSLLAKNGDTLNSTKDPGMAQAISGILSPLKDKVNTILGGLEPAFADDKLGKAILELTATLNEFKTTAGKLNGILAANENKIASVVANLDETSKDLKKSTPKIDSIMNQLNVTTRQLAESDLKKTIEKINATVVELNTLLTQVNKGEGSLGKLVKDDSMYNNINAASMQLDQLLKDIEKYPRRYSGFTEKQRKKGDLEKGIKK
jgi:phospholipid/cholesterol/gamma-HCH transport system substrate-binding protein